MPFDEIPENEIEGYPCECGGSITKCGDKWLCNHCDFEGSVAEGSNVMVQKKAVVVDKNGVEIIKGQTVLVYQEEETRRAKVIEPFPDSPTLLRPGWWVDIDFGDGAQGIMSYILEVIV